MKRILLIFIALLVYTVIHAQGSIVLQDKPFVANPQRDVSIDSVLELNAAYSDLSTSEKEVIYWINFARKNPQTFSKEVVLPFIEQFPEAKNSYTKSLIITLAGNASLAIILPKPSLNNVAKAHAKDIGSTGSAISHSSSNGKSFQQRMNSAGLYNCVSENVYEGKQDALESVLFLLIDNGVKSLGHRKNILDPTAKSVGVSFSPIKGGAQYFLVQNFSCD